MIEAEAWNKLVARVLRARPRRGVRCATNGRLDGVVVSGAASSNWQHPWFIDPRYHFNDDGSGEWRAFIRPSFVNGRDAYISMPADWTADKAPEDGSNGVIDVPLTNDAAPSLVLGGWRNPLLSDSVSASLSGQIIASPGEGYPKIFEKLGVMAPAKGGDAMNAGAMEGQLEENRTRQIRAMDIVLSKARIGTRLDVETRDPSIDAQSESISTVFVNDYVRTTGGRAKLSATAKYRPPEEQSLAQTYGTLLNAGDPQFDELKMATVWIVSPPHADSDAEPDETWTPYPQHFVFWNLQHASRLIPPKGPSAPLRLDVPLAGGVAQPIINSMLSFINDSTAEAEAFFSQADARGKFWSA